MRTRALFVPALLGTLLAAVLTVGTASSASATPNAAPSLTTPAEGATVAGGWTGPVTADFTGVAPDDFRVEVRCDAAGLVDARSVTWDGVTGPAPYDVPAVAGPDACTAKILDGLGAELSSRAFTVTDSPLVLSAVTLSATSFHPVVVDGYEDSMSVTWTQNRTAGVTRTVLDAAGHVVRTVAYATLSPGSHTSTWNGRDDRGVVVPAGVYTIRLDGDEASVTTGTVSVLTGYRTVSRVITRSGEVSAVYHRGACYTTRSRAQHLTGLDCWGGSYGRAAYTFGIPSSTYRISYAVTGSRGDDDLCCDGRVTRVGGRISASAFRVMVTATGWRAYDIHAVRISYAYRQRI